MSITVELRLILLILNIKILYLRQRLLVKKKKENEKKWQKVCKNGEFHGGHSQVWNLKSRYYHFPPRVVAFSK